MKKILKIIGLVVVLVLVYLATVLIWGTINDYSPEPLIQLEKESEALKSIDSTITLLSWNIGFGGLGKESDFFYDGGNMVIPDEEWTEKNLKGIQTILGSLPNLDFILLQEVDLDSKRSHHLNQFEAIGESLGSFESSFAMNYNVDYVPVPYTRPLGQIHSGIASYSSISCYDYQRHGFDTQFSWPTRIFFLDRCFLSQRCQLPNKNELVVINTHNSAYDTSGIMKEAEMHAILKFAKAEYAKGNLVVIGGDWNECPPSYTPIDTSGFYNEHKLSDSDIPEGWQWIADVSTPSNRKLTTTYSKESSYTSVIDFYLISPGFELVEVKTLNTDFEYSDHQPVFISLKIK